jgi:predicted DNA binding CopG/RHH family protein
MGLSLSPLLPVKKVNISKHGIISYQQYLNGINTNSINPNSVGVYIWGLKDPSINNGSFLPYYVGQAGGTGVLNSSNTIKKRIDCHYNFKKYYHRIKSQHLPNFNSFWKTDTELNNLTVQKLKDYRSMHFEYLNKKTTKTNRGYGPLNNYSKVINNPGFLASKVFYQDHFHLCWIEIDPEDPNYQVHITELEKYIYHNLKYQEKKITGKELSAPKYNFLIHQSHLAQNDQFLI